jgi:hypothetical protein
MQFTVGAYVLPSTRPSRYFSEKVAQAAWTEVIPKFGTSMDRYWPTPAVSGLVWRMTFQPGFRQCGGAGFFIKKRRRNDND